jgi:hypothetical protein
MSDDIKYEYYELKRVTVPTPKPGEFSIHTQAVMFCLTCGCTISTIDGPGEAVCIACGDAIRNTQAVGCITWSDGK